jgi:hypothetical protein
MRTPQVPIGTLTTTWNIFGTISRICQGMFFGNSEQVIDREMNNICGVAVNAVRVTPANSQASWTNIRNEIVNNHRMVIVTFVNPANHEEAHSCVAFKARNDVGHRRLVLYNPWGNYFCIRGRNPGSTHNIATTGGRVLMNWKICKYTTLNY